MIPDGISLSRSTFFDRVTSFLQRNGSNSKLAAVNKTSSKASTRDSGPIFSAFVWWLENLEFVFCTVKAFCVHDRQIIWMRHPEAKDVQDFSLLSVFGKKG